MAAEFSPEVMSLLTCLGCCLPGGGGNVISSPMGEADAIDGWVWTQIKISEIA